MKSLPNTSHHNDIPYYSFLPLTLLSLTIVSGIMLSSSIVSADNDTVIDQVNITVPVSCTLSGNGMNSHNAEISNGQYNSAIGETTLKAFCNDNEGFAIYAIGYTDNEDGKNVLTSSTLGNTHDIVTGTATSGNTSNWAMKLTAITSPTPTYPIIIAGSTDDTDKEQGDPDYSAFQEVPDDYTKVAYKTAGTDIGANAEGATLKTTYQAYISSTQPAGTYTGQVKYTLVHPYNTTAPVKPLVNCNPSGTTISTIVCMQDIGPANKSTILTSMAEGTPYLLYDSRDAQQYNVAKLVDGNIWMLDNLALDPTNATTADYLTQQNTNASTAAISNLLNGGNAGNISGWTSEAVVNKTSGWDSTAPNNDYEYPYINSESKDIVVTGYGDGDSKVGIYYNYCAATAGTYCYPSNSGEQDNPTYDLCPASWRMPTNLEFDGIITTIAGSSQVFDSEKIVDIMGVLSLSFSGGFSDSQANNQNMAGGLYSQIMYRSSNIMLVFGEQYLFTIDNDRAAGYPIRCLSAN